MRLYACNRGNTLTEYGMMLGLVALLSVVAIKALGGSISWNLDGVKHSQAPMMKMAALDFDGASAASKGIISNGAMRMKGAGYYVMSIDPTSGLPALRLTDSTTGAVSNATSIEGKEWSILGGFHLADSLKELANSQSDPAVANYLGQMAKISYYMGGAEGELDGVPGLEESDDYSNLDAYHDIVQFQAQMQSLLNSPPPQMSGQVYKLAMPLAADAYNIAHAYSENLAPIAQGATVNFSMPSNQNDSFGTGQPGQALTVSPSDVPSQPGYTASGTTLSQYLTYDQLKSVAGTLLTQNQVPISKPVVATLTDASSLDQTATAVSSGTPVPAPNTAP